VAELRISPATAGKIENKHGVSASEIRDAVVCVPGLAGRWDDDPERGLRMILQVRVRGDRALVVLYPASHPLGDSWNLGSVYITDL
jgi:hypothetical protein